MTNEERDALREYIGVAAEVAAQVAYDNAVAHIERRLSEHPILRFAGAWEDGVVYQPGHTVQFGGSIYHCDKATTARPDAHFGSGKPGDWTLMVKKGRDGKDARVTSTESDKP